MSTQQFDVLIIGAGISGIGAAYYVQQAFPNKRYAILEARDDLGGTWDLFRYPGVRSDSSMLTMSYQFKPWEGTQTTADGASILNYLHETAVENGIDRHIHYGQRVSRTEWSSTDALWTVYTDAGDTFSGNFLLMCAGYYSYESGYMPDFEGQARFTGSLIHPQGWPADLDYAHKQIVVIGSGATAVTLVPKLAETAAHVTMLQRSPTYMRAMPNESVVASRIRQLLPAPHDYRLLRWLNVYLGHLFYRQTRRNPAKVKREMIDLVRAELPPDFDVEKHFTPHYNPWDQRVCLVPDGDLFTAIRAGTASVETDEIETFTETGLLLKSGKRLEADIIVTATGLNLEVMGGIEFAVDGEPIDFAKTVSYRGMMISNVPNMVALFGYINASWTLGVDLTGEFICKLLQHMDKVGARQCTPRLENVAQVATDPYIKDFSSGYMQRSMHLLPRQGRAEPWTNNQDYLRDRKVIKQLDVNDGVLVFSGHNMGVRSQVT